MISEVHANWSKTQVGLSERSKKLKASLFETEESLSRLYGFLEKGTVQIDDILEKRIETLRNCRAKDD